MARDLKEHIYGLKDVVRVKTDEVQFDETPAANGEIGMATNRLLYRSGGTNYTVKNQTDEVTLIKPFAPWDIGYYTASTAGVLTKNADGDWSINRTAGGAETHTFAIALPIKSETAGKGIKLSKVRWIYEIGVADATSVDVTFDSVAYVQATDPAVTADYGGAIADASYDANHNTAVKRADKDVTGGEHVLEVSVGTPAFFVTADANVICEFIAVLALNGTLKIRGAEAEYVFEEPTA